MSKIVENTDVGLVGLMHALHALNDIARLHGNMAEFILSIYSLNIFACHIHV